VWQKSVKQLNERKIFLNIVWVVYKDSTGCRFISYFAISINKLANSSGAAGIIQRQTNCLL
jgi:hypothetical protein